jgi:metal-sulfur cluster biosynthetic enzyme
MNSPHDRELPVSATDADRPSHRVVPPPIAGSESQGTSNADASEAVIGDAAAETLTEDQVKLALRRVKDPELNLNILDLGLVYEIRVDGNAVSVDMTLTSPGCPSGPEIMTDAERHLKAIPGVGDVAVNLVWSPFWSPERIEPRVRAYLGF